MFVTVASSKVATNYENKLDLKSNIAECCISDSNS